MKRLFLLLTALTAMVSLLTGCVTGGASNLANARADQNRYQPVNYVNGAKQGPYLVVIPGEIKSSHATFTQKVTSNNIADYAELELGRANFRVLERSDLGYAMQELRLAFDMGDPSALRKFKRGKFKSTQWLVKFDILKAEPVAEAETGFDLGVLAGVLGSRIDSTARRVMQSTGSGEAAQVWLVGMRYKVINANTSEQVTTGYFEDKREIGAQGFRFVGFNSASSGGTGMDTMIQRLVQQSVAELDRKK